METVKVGWDMRVSKSAESLQVVVLATFVGLVEQFLLECRLLRDAR